MSKVQLTRGTPIAIGLATLVWALFDAIAANANLGTILLAPLAAGLLGSCVFKGRLASALLGFGLAVVLAPVVLGVFFHAYQLRFGESIDGISGSLLVTGAGFCCTVLSPSLAALSTHLQKLIVEYP